VDENRLFSTFLAIPVLFEAIARGVSIRAWVLNLVPRN